jgi:hypothetical protein
MMGLPLAVSWVKRLLNSEFIRLQFIKINLHITKRIRAFLFVFFFALYKLLALYYNIYDK